jgi:Uma2 family endonuclease
MARATSLNPGYTAESYFGLVHSGLLDTDDHVELLDGLIVAMPPQDPEHASAVGRIGEALRCAVGGAVVIRAQSPLVLGPSSVPEPDVAVVAGRRSDYDHHHPTTALLIIEVAKSSLPQDRLTKSRIYATAQIPEYWIVNLRDDCVEVLRAPVAATHGYGERHVLRRGAFIALPFAVGCSVAVDDLLPDCLES